MSQRVGMSSLALMLVLSATVRGQEAPLARKADPLVAVIEKLREPAEISQAETRTLKLEELLRVLEKRHGITLRLGADLSTPESQDAEVEVRFSGGRVPLGRALQSTLAQRGLTYLVRKDGLEIVPMEAAAREARTRLDESLARPRFTSPLVSAVFVEKPLHEVLATLSEDYDVTVGVTAKAGDARTGFVSARFLNVPLEQALETLALQTDLRVLRRANSYLLTSPDHANQVFSEKLDQQRQKFEVENSSPPLPPVPAPPAPAQRVGM